MNVGPVITRELRAQARQRYTYVLRMLGVIALICCGGIGFWNNLSFARNMGGLLFGVMHFTLFCAIWVLVPLGAADCIARERREGTLGLLFLTSLKPHEIVIAKSIAHGLRALTLLFSVLPVLTIPFLLGGVSWRAATLSAVTNFCSICWALAAALIGSAQSKSYMRAIVLTMVMALLALWTFAQIVDQFLVSVSRLATSGFTYVPTAQLWGGVLTVIVISLFVLGLAIVIGASRIRRSWQEEPPPAWVGACQKTFCTPVIWTGFFRRWLRRKLERNPIGWLEQRTWMGRLVTWSWFAIIASVYSAVLSDSNFFRNASGVESTMAWLLLGSMAASVSASFRRERENGVMELLLVSPLAAGSIINGRLRGLWGQFFPAVTVLLGVWFYFAQIFHNYDDLPRIFYFLTAYLTLPLIGLYFSLTSRGFISAFLATLLFGLGLTPLLVRLLVWAIATFVEQGRGVFDMENEVFFIGAMVIQSILAAAFGKLLFLRLKHRNFPMERALA